MEFSFATQNPARKRIRIPREDAREVTRCEKIDETSSDSMEWSMPLHGAPFPRDMPDHRPRKDAVDGCGFFFFSRAARTCLMASSHSGAPGPILICTSAFSTLPISRGSSSPACNSRQRRKNASKNEGISLLSGVQLPIARGASAQVQQKSVEDGDIFDKFPPRKWKFFRAFVRAASSLSCSRGERPGALRKSL